MRAASTDVMTSGSTTSARPASARFARNAARVVASGSSREPVCGSTAWTRAAARRAPAASHAVDRPFHDPISTMSPLPVVAAAALKSAQPCASDNHPSIAAASGRTSSHVRISTSPFLSARPLCLWPGPLRAAMGEHTCFACNQVTKRSSRRRLGKSFAIHRARLSAALRLPTRPTGGASSAAWTHARGYLNPIDDVATAARRDGRGNPFDVRALSHMTCVRYRTDQGDAPCIS